METSKTIKPEENAEASEMLGYIMGQLKHNGGKWDLTDDAGKPDIMLSKDCTPCAVIPLGYFEDDTIRAIVEMISL